MNEPSSQFDPVEVLVDEYLEQYRRGERPSLTELTQAHPDHAERLRSLISAVLVMEEFGPGSEDDPLSALTPSHASIPQRLGDYVLLRLVGSGGMGAVYEAIQESLGRHVALKTIPTRQPDDATRLERFRREALAAARLHHTHIVPVYGLGEHDGLHFYTMQFIQGCGLDLVLREVDRLRRGPTADEFAAGASESQDLSTHLAWALCHGRFLPQSPLGVVSAGGDAGPRLSTTRLTRSGGPSGPSEVRSLYLASVAWIGVQIAEALEYAHQQGVLHRDVKPSNLLMDAQGHAWVTDFGLAKTQDGDELTQTGDVVGTLRYMAPERFNGWSDPRSDVFALGATLYELSTLRPAFDEMDRLRLVDRLLHGRPRPLRDLDRRIPRDLETIILKALASASGERYATAGQMADDLRRFVSGRPILARRSNAIERAWRWSRRNPAGAGAVALVASTLTASAALSLIYAKEQSLAAREIRNLAADLAKERESLRASLAESQRILAIRNFDRAQAALEKDQVGLGLHWMLAAWRSAREAKDPAWQQVALANLSAWSLHLPRLKAVLSHEGPVDAAVFHPDGKSILTGGDDGMARLWGAESAEPIGRPLPHPGTVFAVAFSPDGKTLLTGDGDGKARRWDAAAGRPIGSPLPHAGDVQAVAFSPDGKILLTGGTEPTARLWDAATGRPIGPPLACSGAVTTVAFSPDGRLAVTGGRDRLVRFWTVPDGKPFGPTLPHQGEVLALAFSPDGDILLTGGTAGVVQAWDVATGRPLTTQLTLHRGHVRGLAFSPDGRTYLTGSEDKTARLWNAATHRSIGSALSHQGPVVAVAFRPDGQLFLTASSDHTVRVWESGYDGDPQLVLRRPGGGRSVAFRPDGRSFFGVSWDGTGRLWDASTGIQISQTLRSQSVGASVACSPNGETFAIGGTPARLWDPATGLLVGQDLVHPRGAAVVAFSPDGKTLVTGGPDRTTRLWDAVTGQPIGAPVEHLGSVDAVAFHPDGKTLVVGYDAGSAQAWDVATRQPIGPSLKHPGAVSAAAFSPDGKTLITGCEDGMARLWDPSAGTLRVPPLTHQAWVFAVAFSPNGKSVLTGSRDRTVRLWDVATGQPVGPPYLHSAHVWTISVASDGQSFVTGDMSNTAQVYTIAPTLPNDPDHVDALLQTLTGLRFDAARGHLLVLDNAAWRAARDRLKPPERGTAQPRPSHPRRYPIR